MMRNSHKALSRTLASGFFIKFKLVVVVVAILFPFKLGNISNLHR